MKPTAVTPAASAAAIADDREPSSHFLPTDHKYRMTGELPEGYEPQIAGTQVADDTDRGQHASKEEPATPDKEEQDGSDAAAAASTGEDGEHEAGQDEGEQVAGEGSGEPAAASQAAATREERTPGPKPAPESRWAKLSRENRELKQRLEKVEQRGGAAAQARDTTQASQPAAATAAATSQSRPEPKIEDVDPKTGKAKYATFTDYLSDLRKWDREQITLESQTTQQRTAQEQATKAVNMAWGKKVDDAKKSGKYKDFKEVALADDLPIKLGGPVDLFMLSSPIGTDVLYHLGKNRAELTRINGLNPLEQVRELTKLEIKLTAKAPPRTPAITTAARPPHQASGTGKGTVTKDAVEKAVEEGDSESYMREQNRRDLERRKRGK